MQRINNPENDIIKLTKAGYLLNKNFAKKQSPKRQHLKWFLNEHKKILRR